jgi:hypothetical protein
MSEGDGVAEEDQSDAKATMGGVDDQVFEKHGLSALGGAYGKEEV